MGSGVEIFWSTLPLGSLSLFCLILLPETHHFLPRNSTVVLSGPPEHRDFTRLSSNGGGVAELTYTLYFEMHFENVKIEFEMKSDSSLNIFENARAI